MKIGLTLGKFAPLHLGHQLVIDTALNEMDRVICLIYDCEELSTCPLPVRSRWLREIYPNVEVIEAWDGPTKTGLDPATTAQHDAYLLNRVGLRGITHFYSSEPYGQHVSQALGAIDRRVEPERKTVPISGTLLRTDPYAHRQLVHPRVYWDLITKAVFLGAPSTGKTTIAQALASDFGTAWVPEYGREYWNEHQIERRLSIQQLLEIAYEHRKREAILCHDAKELLFVDTDASTTLQFSLLYHDQAPSELKSLANETRERYDLFFLCEADIPYDDTWDRSGEVVRSQMQRRIESDLVARKIPFTRLTGSIKQRIQQVRLALKQASNRRVAARIER